MLKAKIVSLTTLHFGIACLFIFLAIGATGYGFKNAWGLFDYFYVFISIGGAAILTFPLWLILYIPDMPGWLFYLGIPAQIVISYSQVILVIFLYGRLSKK